MLTPAPIAVASPARKASCGWCVAKATAKIGASVDREPLMSPVIAGCARWSRNDRWSRCPFARANMWLLLGAGVNIPVGVAASSRVDLRGRGDVGPLAAGRVRDEPGHFDRRPHLPGDAVQRQLTVDDRAVAGLAD